MGSGCSSIERRNKRLLGILKQTKSSTFAHYAATLPKLFCEVIASNSNKFICSCNVSSNYNEIIFAVTDAVKQYYQRVVSADDLKDIVSHQIIVLC